MVLVANALLVAAGLLIVATRDRRALVLALAVVPLVVALVEIEAGLAIGGVATIGARLIAQGAAVAVLALCALSGERSKASTSLPNESASDVVTNSGVSVAAGLESALIPFLSALLLAFGVTQFATQHQIAGPIATFPIFWLIGVGVLGALLTRDPFKLGIAFLLIVSGVGLAALALPLGSGIRDGGSGSIALTIAAEGIFAILLALVMSHLASTHGTSEDVP